MFVDKKNYIIAILALVILGGLGYWYGSVQYKKGYAVAQADIEAQQKLLSTNASNSAAQAANPFKIANPLQGVSINPFSEAKKTLNPFK